MKRFFAALLLILSLTLITSAEIKVETREGRITGIARSGSLVIQVDMPGPLPPPETLQQTKLEPLPLSRDKAQQAVTQLGSSDAGCVPDLAGKRSKWEALRLECQALYDGYGGPERPLDPGNPQHLKADKTARAFLDSLNITGYEYPFYAVLYDYQHSESPLWPTLSQQEAFKDDFDEQLAREQGLFGAPHSLVVVRFPLNGIPFITQKTENPRNRNEDNASPYAIFDISPEGKVWGVLISNLSAVQKTAPDPRPILSWQEALQAGADWMNARLGSLDMYTLLFAEFSLYTDDKNMAQPCWRFVLDRNSSNDPNIPKNYRAEKHYHDVISLVVNAHTGAVQ